MTVTARLVIERMHRLDRPTRVLIVRTGSLQVYALGPKGRGRRARQRVGVFGVGQSVWAVETDPEFSHELVAIAAERVEVDEITLAAEGSASLEADDTLRALINGWCDTVSRELGIEVAPTTAPAERLRALHGAARTRLAALAVEAETRDEERRRARAFETSRRMGEAVHRLSAVVSTPRLTRAQVAAAPIVAAIQAAAAAQGTAITVPLTIKLSGNFTQDVEEIRRACRLRMRRVVLKAGWWRKDSGPLVGQILETNRPVALVPRGPAAYDVLDPNGETYPITAEVAATIAPVAFVPYRQLPTVIAGPLQLVRFAWAGQRRNLLITLFTGIAATLVAMCTPIAISLAVSRAIPDGNRGLLWRLGATLIAAALGRGLFEVAQAIAATRMEARAGAELQAAVWDRVLNLRLADLRRFPTGELQSRVSAIDSIRQALGTGTIRTLFLSSVSFINFGLMAYYSVPLAVVALFAAAFVGSLTLLAGLRGQARLPELREVESDTFGLVVQMVQAAGKLRVAGAEGRAFAEWAQRFARQQGITRDVQMIQDQLTGFTQTLPLAATAILFALAGQLTGGSNGMTVGTFLGFNVTFGAFIGATVTLSQSIIRTSDAFQLWTRARPVLEAVPEIDDSKADPGTLRGAVRLSGVTFRYRSDGPLTLSDVSLQANPGDFIAIVGPSGSGKSTLLRLLLGFERPQAGGIYFDGQDLSGLDMQAVRRQLGVVLQGGRILSAPIFENIAAGTPITLNDAWEAARQAGFAEDVESFPMTMHTYVSEGGGNLSGGQRQRLLVARALARKPRILFFDEATSALDNRTQAIVTASLKALGVTRIVIAHRLSTVQNADRIYVLAGGRVVQSGRYADLAEQDGVFARLMARQRA